MRKFPQNAAQTVLVSDTPHKQGRGGFAGAAQVAVGPRLDFPLLFPRSGSSLAGLRPIASSLEAMALRLEAIASRHFA